MRRYNIVPWSQLRDQSLSKDGLKRLGWIDWYYSHGRNAQLTCRHFGISKSVFYRWFNRFNKRNLKTLEFDMKTRRPQRVRTPNIPLPILQRVYDIRHKDLEKSKYEIQEDLKREGIILGQSAIQRVINSHRELLNTQHRKRVKRHKRYSIARIKAVRELREKEVGSLVQVDTKYFYILKKKFYLFSAIDCYSRFAFIYGYKSISSHSGKDFIKRVRGYFPFTIQAVNTDNGSEYLLEFHKEVSSWGIPHYFTDPHCPKQNARVERLHQTAEYEYFNYQIDLLDDLDMVNEHCMKFNYKYNFQRYHRSLSYKTPGEYVMLHLYKKGGQPFSI
jgi:transposase InsO family protein